MKTVDAAVDDLLSVALAAHGGLDHWRRFGSVSANLVTAGQLWDIKGIGQEDTRRHIQVSLRTEWLSLAPFGDPSWRMVFTPSRVAIRARDGRLVAERMDPRSSFAGHELNTPWDPQHCAYWNGYTLWTYLTTPFLLAEPGFEISVIPPGTRVMRFGRVCGQDSRHESQATLRSKISTLVKTTFFGGTTTALTLPVASRPLTTYPITWSQAD